MELINSIDETISFNEKNIRILGTPTDPWFVAKDICQILELKDVSRALEKIPDKWKGTKVIRTLGGNQDMRMINEAGLYKLIMRSNKPIAQKFQEVVCEEILPSLRKKGEYKIHSIIERNKELEQENQRLSIEKDEEVKRIEEKLVENNEENRLKMCKTIIESYDNKHVVYLGYIGIINGKKSFKFGSSARVLKRIYREHNKTYEIFEFVYCIECDHHLKLENALKSDEKLKKYRFSHPFHVEGSDKLTNVSELIYFDDKFTLDSFKKLVLKLKNNIEMVDELRIHSEKTKQLELELQMKKEEEQTKRHAKELEEQTKLKQLELEILKLKVENSEAVRQINDENINHEIKKLEEELTSKIESEREIDRKIQEKLERKIENKIVESIDINVFENIYYPIQVTYRNRNTFLYVAKINDKLYINVNSISEKSYPMERWKRGSEITRKMSEYNTKFKNENKQIKCIYSYKNKGTWILFDFFCENYFNWYGIVYEKVNRNTDYLSFGTFLDTQLPKLIDEYDLSKDKHFVQIKKEVGDSSFKVRANRETNFINVTDLFNGNNRDVRSFNKGSERKKYFLTNPEEHYVTGNGIIDEFGMKVTFCHPKLAIVIVDWLYKKRENEEKHQLLEFVNYFMDKV